MSRTDAILRRLSALHPKLIDLSLDRILPLLADLGNPHEHLPAVIHVAGTNAKGSTIAYLRAFLEASGQRVHVYNSPHLVRFNERIRLAGRLVDTRRLNAALEHVEAINAHKPMTFFEITTAAAFKLFAETPADYLLLETGMGGTYDTTNVVRQPLGVIITPVDLDHQAFLGNTIAKIAGEKAGSDENRGVGSVCAGGDGGNRHIAVTEIESLTFDRITARKLAGLLIVVFKSRREIRRDGFERQAAFRTLGAGHGGHDVAEVEFQRVREDEVGTVLTLQPDFN